MSEATKDYKRHTIQFPNDLYAHLVAEAESEKRSLSGQVILILEHHYYEQTAPYKFLTDRDARPSLDGYHKALTELADRLEKAGLSPNEPDRSG